jgi:hypothetical protein
MNNTAEIGGDFCTMGIKLGWGILNYGIQVFYQAKVLLVIMMCRLQ